jgi:hypothetical protein
MKVVSLLPSATEMVSALGLADLLVGVSHHCKWPDPAPVYGYRQDRGRSSPTTRLCGRVAFSTQVHRGVAS